MSFEDTTLILPTLNEKENLPFLLKLIKKLYPDLWITIVDDGSNDGTKELAISYSKKNKKIKFLNRENKKKHGLCISIIEAIKKTKTRYFIVMDADLQHPPEIIKEIKKSLERKNKLVIATRKKVEKWKIQRRLMSKVANHLAKISLFCRRKKTPKDILSGFFGGESLLFKDLIKKNSRKFEYGGYKILFDFLKILPKKIEIKEIPYNFGERKMGQSKIKKRHVFYFVKSLFK